MAVNYLSRNGMRIVKRNYLIREGEIDIVGYHKGYLVFVEVKYRKSTKKGSAEDAVGYGKQKTICRVADHYRYVHGLGDEVPVRYDVLAVYNEEIVWYQNAFSHIYRVKFML